MTEAMTFVATHSHDLQLPHQTPPSARLQLFILSIRFKHSDGSHKPQMRVISGRQYQFGEQSTKELVKDLCKRVNKSTSRLLNVCVKVDCVIYGVAYVFQDVVVSW